MDNKFSSQKEVLKFDGDNLTLNIVALYDEGSNEIKRSLNLIDKTENGTKITWKSSNTDRITNGGRVIRPKWTEKNEVVTITATLENGTETLTKEFNFTVLKDEDWEDNQEITDEELYGVWKGGKWEVESMFDYSIEGLAEVEKAVKNGDLKLAKVEMQKHFANRQPKTEVPHYSRDKLHAMALVDDFHHLQGEDYFQGDMTVKNEWGNYETPIRCGNIIPGAVGSYSVRTWYNEYSHAEFCRHDDENPDFRPKIEIQANGETFIIPAIDSLVVRAGQYKEVNYGEEKALKARTFGDFLGDETYYSILKFDFSSLKEGTKIDSAKLILHGKSYPEYAGDKRIIIIREPTNTWCGSESCWKNFAGYVYSYNGIPTKNDWLHKPEGSDFEYWYQMCRFAGYPDNIIGEYFSSGDGDYMYKMLNILNDYLKDTAHYKLATTTRQDPDGYRGGFCRSLDAVIKNTQFMKMIEVIAQYKTTTPELFTAILKNIWDTANFLTYIHTKTGNWRQAEYKGILEASIKMPEFRDALSGRNWRKISSEVLEEMLFLNNREDGSYVEATCGYSQGAFANYLQFKQEMSENGIDVSPKYDELLHKCAYYNALTYTPNGSTLQYGDNGFGKRSGGKNNSFYKAAEIYNDKELEYIATLGESGTEPKWTSKVYYDSTVSLLRSDWTKDAYFMYSNVRGGGQHGHHDFNGLIIAAKGRTLLTDAGIFTYTSTDPFRIWGRSTKAHNTVLINDESSDFDGNGGFKSTGKILEFQTNDKFDFLSQTIPYKADMEHRRTVMFIKPLMWIVSDLMIPADKEKSNNYKQNWHMLPSSNFSVCESTRNIISNFEKGANIIVANADKFDSKLFTEMGYYDQNYQSIQKNPFAYFEKTAQGDTTFDTVLIPNYEDPTAKAVVEKLSSRENTTSLRIDFTLNGKAHTAYYYMSYDKKGDKFGEDDEYETDAYMAYVELDENKKVVNTYNLGGAYIKDKSGNVINK